MDMPQPRYAYKVYKVPEDIKVVVDLIEELGYRPKGEVLEAKGAMRVYNFTNPDDRTGLSWVVAILEEGENELTVMVSPPKGAAEFVFGQLSKILKEKRVKKAK